MSADEFLRQIRLGPHERIMRAIAILQQMEIATHSVIEPANRWGADFMPSTVIEHIIELLLPCLDEVAPDDEAGVIYRASTRQR